MQMKFKFTLILIVLTGALSTIGYYGQNALTQLVQSIQKESAPNYRLNLLQEISSSLLIGENSINRFSLTKIPNDLDNYYETVSTIDAKLDSFDILSASSDKHMVEAQNLKALIEEKLVISSDVISLKDKENTFVAYNRILHAIRKQENDSSASLVRTEIVVEKDSTFNQELTSPGDSSSLLASEEEPKRQSIFRKIFGRKKNTPEPIASLELSTAEATPIDSIPPSSTEVVNLDSTRTTQIKSIINRIKQEETALNRRITDQELELLARDRLVSLQLTGLIEQNYGGRAN